MTSIPIMLDVRPVTLDDETILDGAASVWAVMTFASDLPATPETKAALEQARTAFLDELHELGFRLSDIEHHLDRRRSTGRGLAGGHPPD